MPTKPSVHNPALNLRQTDDVTSLRSKTTYVGDAGDRTPPVYQVLTFVVLSVPNPKIWLIFGHGVKRPTDLDLDL